MRPSRRTLLIGGLLGTLVWVGNLPVSYHQGVNFKVQTIQIPLFWKTLHFLSRHDQMRRLTRQIVQDQKSQEDKMNAIHQWIRHEFHRGIPPGLPVVDDHVLDIAIRRYGTEDQVNDLFVALCAYAGLKAQWYRISPGPRWGFINISVVEVSGRIVVVDPYRDYLPHEAGGKLADLRFLQANAQYRRQILSLAAPTDFPYEPVLLQLPTDFKGGMNRGIDQMPVARFFHLLGRRMSR